ncbi:MAG: hypothetical protein KAS32_17865, partial [Candidatus Peribacteraceae bacterium]|nr:hypothetical protein [Candidatus Peribacteraceae bacterium]
GASINWIDASGKLHVASAWIQLDESATTPGFYEVEVVTVTTGYNTIKPRDNESYLLIIEFDASNAI